MWRKVEERGSPDTDTVKFNRLLKEVGEVNEGGKLQALVYQILPP